MDERTPDDGGPPPFAPAGRDLFEAADDRPPPPPPPPPAGERPATAFSVAEVTHDAPLWRGTPREVPGSGGGARDNSWMVVTAILVAIFVAVTVGYTVLSEGGTTSQSIVDDTPLTRTGPTDVTRPLENGSTIPDGATTVPDTADPVPTTTVPLGEWGEVVAPDGTFRAQWPGELVAVDSAMAGSPATEFTSGPFRILSGALAATAIPEVDAALREVAVEAGAPAGEIATARIDAYPGGMRVLDFAVEQGTDTVQGRVMAVDGRRFLLTMTVPTAEVADPATLADLVRFRNGFQP